MNLYQRLVYRLIKKLDLALKSYNKIDDLESIRIDKSVVLRGSNISGNVNIQEGCFLNGPLGIVGDCNVEIDRYTSLNGPGLLIYSKLNRIKIGSFCSIAQNVLIIEHNHFVTRPSTYFFSKNVFGESDLKNAIQSKGEILIGNDVWIGAQSVVLSGSKIGNGAIIAANSVVSGEIPPFAIVGGTPAKILKFRFENNLIEKLHKIQWWNWPTQKIKENKSFFLNELTIDSINQIV